MCDGTLAPLLGPTPVVGAQGVFDMMNIIHLSGELVLATIAHTCPEFKSYLKPDHAALGLLFHRIQDLLEGRCVTLPYLELTIPCFFQNRDRLQKLAMGLHGQSPGPILVNLNAKCMYLSGFSLSALAFKTIAVYYQPPWGMQMACPPDSAGTISTFNPTGFPLAPSQRPYNLLLSPSSATSIKNGLGQISEAPAALSVTPTTLPPHSARLNINSNFEDPEDSDEPHAAALVKFKPFKKRPRRGDIIITDENSLLTQVMARGSFLHEWARDALKDNKKLLFEASSMFI